MPMPITEPRVCYASSFCGGNLRLTFRGMRTLPWRMRGHCENAIKVAEFLSQHPRVERVHYPGLRSHPGHEIARKQMSMFGGMLSVEVKGGRDAAMKLAAKTKIFT